MAELEAVSEMPWFRRRRIRAVPVLSPAPANDQGCAAPGERASLAAGVVDTTPALVCVVDRQARITLANASLLRLTGYEEREVLGRSILDVLVIPEDVVPARTGFRQAVTTGETEPIEADWRDRHGGLHRIAIQSSVLRGTDGEVEAVTYVGADVTEERRHRAELRRRADTDQLTGLRNRAALLGALHAALSPDGRSGCIGLLFCDLDGFKRVNDEHGHLVGDAVLVEIGRRLLAVTGADQVVSRLGGDEFLILVPDATPTSLGTLSAAIEATIGRPFVSVHGDVAIGVSVGTALGRAGDDPAQLIEQADRHMYGIKTAAERAARGVPTLG